MNKLLMQDNNNMESKPIWDTGMGWVCEAHPDKEFEHDDCPGPGMPDKENILGLNNTQNARPRT